MTRAKLRNLTVALAVLAGSALAVSIPQIRPQMPPETSSIVRNDSTVQVSFEIQISGEWTKTTLNPSQDTKITADRIRVATTRDDNATLTVDLPIQRGKKYRIFWNSQTSMWDIGGTA